MVVAVVPEGFNSCVLTRTCGEEECYAQAYPLAITAVVTVFLVWVLPAAAQAGLTATAAD